MHSFIQSSWQHYEALRMGGNYSHGTVWTTQEIPSARATSQLWVLVDSQGNFEKCRCLGPSPRGSEGIGLGWARALIVILKSTPYGPSVLPRLRSTTLGLVFHLVFLCLWEITWPLSIIWKRRAITTLHNSQVRCVLRKQ